MTIIAIVLFSVCFGWVNQGVVTSLSLPLKEPFRLSQYRKYPLSPFHHQRYINRLQSKNITLHNYRLPKQYLAKEADEDDFDPAAIFEALLNKTDLPVDSNGFRVIVNKQALKKLAEQLNSDEDDDDEDDDDEDDYHDNSNGNRNSRSTYSENPGVYFDQNGNLIKTFGNRNGHNQHSSSENFQVVRNFPTNFTDIGGYDNIKRELYQCIDILANYSKYAPYNVRVPKGLIFEGPPGNGKTLLAKALAGEAKSAFIAVSGSEFQEKYVGVGSSRIRELFKLARNNIPCIVFIDEIDALGRKRSGEGEATNSERDSTLNELLVALDGFKNSTGIFVIGATNRADLLDPALVRPGRIDKRIFIGNPDSATRRAILNIHSSGKPYDESVDMEGIVEVTQGLSGAQIENLINEAMLHALRYDRKEFSCTDVDDVLNKMLVGWQPSEHQFTSDMIDQIAIHELGHAVVGLLCKHHSKMTKVIINLSAPKSPAYTVFEGSTTSLFTREALFEHLMILLSGRIAEEVFYNLSVTTGALSDFEEALKLAEKMVVYYGMGKQLIYPSMSEKYKEMIDAEVAALIHDAYAYAEFLIRNSKELIAEGAEILKRDKTLRAETLIDLMNDKHRGVLTLKFKNR
jgi:cell division protease FtsH